MKIDNRYIKSNRHEVTFRCNPHIKSAVELNGVVILNLDSGDSIFIGYPQAAVWDLVSRDFSFKQILKMISAITGQNEVEVERLIIECLNDWAENGYLAREVRID